MSAQKNHTRLLFSIIISLLVVLLLSGCIDMAFPGGEVPNFAPVIDKKAESVLPDDLEEPGDPGASGVYGSDGDDDSFSGQSDDPCEEFSSEVNVYSLYAMEQGNPPQIKVAANAAEQAPPAGINVTSGGVSTGYGTGMILWQEGDWVEASTSDSYQALGVQVHGDKTIGWAKVLFDGLEIWRGDASAHIIGEGRHGFYVEVRCFPTGTHTLRIEGLGLEGSGGGRSIPVSYFGFRE